MRIKNYSSRYSLSYISRDLKNNLRELTFIHTRNIIFASIFLLGFAGTLSAHRPFATAPTLGITDFNSAWAAPTNLLGSTATPGTVLNAGNTGWDFTVSASTGNVSMSASAAGADPGGASDYCIRMNRLTAGATVTYADIKSDDGSSFKLDYAYLKINLVAGSSADMTITGYKAGVAVTGATKTITGILTNPVWTQFDVSTNPAFDDVDEFRFTQAASSSATISFMAVDEFDISTVVILPLTLTSFSGALNGNDVSLNWQTASEQNTSDFEIQRSEDNAHFSTIATVPAAGNSDLTKNYSYTDILPASPSSSYLYRLKMNDQDGSSTFSQEIRISPPTTHQLTLSAVPNPFHSQLSLLVNAQQNDIAIFVVRDMNGKSLLTQSIPISAGSNTITLPGTGSLPSGAYALTMYTRGQKLSIGVVKSD